MNELIYELLKWELLILSSVAACFIMVGIGILIIHIILAIPILIRDGIECFLIYIKNAKKCLKTKQ